MKFRLCLFLVVTATVGFNNAIKIRPVANPCIKECTQEEMDNTKKICIKGYHFDNLCEKKCKGYESQEIIECEKGTREDCWNNDCTDEEKDPRNKFCFFNPNFNETTDTNFACSTKCDFKVEKKIEVKWLDCQDYYNL